MFLAGRESAVAKARSRGALNATLVFPARAEPSRLE